MYIKNVHNVIECLKIIILFRPQYKTFTQKTFPPFNNIYLFIYFYHFYEMFPESLYSSTLKQTPTTSLIYEGGNLCSFVKVSSKS